MEFLLKKVTKKNNCISFDWEKAFKNYKLLIRVVSTEPTTTNIRKLALWVSFIAPQLPKEVEKAVWESLYAALPIEAVIKFNELFIDDFQASTSSR